MARGPCSRRVRTVSSTRWFSVITWRTRRKVSSSSRSRARGRSSISRSAARRTPRARAPALAGCPACGVAPGRVLVAHAGVDDEQFEAGGIETERDDLGLEGSAVEEHGRVPASEQRGRLVHDAGRCSDGHILSQLTDFRELGAAQAELPDVAQRQRDRALESCRRGQPRPDRHRRVDEDVEAGHGAEVSAGASEGPGDAQRIGGPAAERLGLHIGEVDLDEFVGERAADARTGVVAHADRGDRPAVDSERQHEAFVVVGVLADEVDAAGSRPQAVAGRPNTSANVSRTPSRRSVIVLPLR